MMDGKNIGAMDTTAPHTLTIPGGQIPEGVHSFSAVMFDLDGSSKTIGISLAEVSR